ncbi:uncharacterized protein LOC144107433 [Amblyomma americanum]
MGLPGGPHDNAGRPIPPHLEEEGRKSSGSTQRKSPPANAVVSGRQKEGKLSLTKTTATTEQEGPETKPSAEEEHTGPAGRCRPTTTEQPGKGEKGAKRQKGQAADANHTGTQSARVPPPARDEHLVASSNEKHTASKKGAANGRHKTDRSKQTEAVGAQKSAEPQNPEALRGPAAVLPERDPGDQGRPNSKQAERARPRGQHEQRKASEKSKATSRQPFVASKTARMGDEPQAGGEEPVGSKRAGRPGKPQRVELRQPEKLQLSGQDASLPQSPPLKNRAESLGAAGGGKSGAVPERPQVRAAC